MLVIVQYYDGSFLELTGPGFLAPTGKSFKLSGMSLCRFKDGRLIEDKAESDGLYFMEQLGYSLVPPKN
jgi:predicted ester cyclase